MNARTEFEKHTAGSDVLCATLTRGAEYEDSRSTFTLREGHSAGQLVEFLISLEFEYDDGYGGQELFGFIWYKDGTWSERMEYDGSEWWRHVERPIIPVECR